MYLHFSYTQPSPDQLSQQTWRFYLLDRLHAVLDHYTEEMRPSKRHKFRAVKAYYRLNERNSTLGLAGVPFPDDVVAVIRQQMIDEIKITKEHVR